MSKKSLEVTKSAIAVRQENGFNQMLDMRLSPDGNGLIKEVLDGGTTVTINTVDGTVSAEGTWTPKIYRTYEVGHDTMSGKRTEFDLSGIIVRTNDGLKTRVSFNMGKLEHEFPDGQSYIVVRGSGSESVTLY